MPLKNSWFAGKSPQLSKIVADKSADFFGLADHFFSGPKKKFFRAPNEISTAADTVLVPK